jgi:hypothetical protein
LSPDQKRWSIQPSNSGGIYAKKGISTQSYNSSHHCLIKDSPNFNGADFKSPLIKYRII